ncbi:hypothetical protein [Janthinobacterium sp. BJB426]|uniref:hypothetical protein n=1 Tax=Janthinobacterium sp. BJB426 TaxID=2048010 RepID=UPI0013051C03|nr:hypothetical protein [Janthinobacterium sp. BJB426]
MKKTYVLLAIALIGGSVAIAIIGNQVGLTRDTWPGWVQAIGSIAALVVAIFVMTRQNSAATKLVNETDLRALQRRAKAVSALVDRAHLQLRSSIDEVQTEAESGTTHSLNMACHAGANILSQVRIALQQIPPYELGSYGMVDGLHQTINAISIFESTAASWLGDQRTSKPPQPLLNVIPKLRDAADVSYSVFKAGLAELDIN